MKFIWHNVVVKDFRFEDKDLRLVVQGQGLVVQGQGQEFEVQGQGLVNRSSRTRTFLKDNNTGLQQRMASLLIYQ